MQEERRRGLSAVLGWGEEGGVERRGVERRGEERSDKWKAVSYCAVVVYGRRFVPSLLRSSRPSLLLPPLTFH